MGDFSPVPSVMRDSYSYIRQMSSEKILTILKYFENDALTEGWRISRRKCIRPARSPEWPKLDQLDPGESWRRLVRRRQLLSVVVSRPELARQHLHPPRIPRCLESSPFRVNGTERRRRLRGWWLGGSPHQTENAD